MFKIQKEKLILVAFIVAAVVPHFDFTVDRIGNQWLYLSIVLVLASIYSFYVKKIDLLSIKSSSWVIKWFLWLFTFFVLVSFLSFIKASNKVESMIVLSQYTWSALAIFIAGLGLGYLIGEKK